VILQDKMKREERQRVKQIKETEARVILHGHKWSRFVQVPDMIIF